MKRILLGVLVLACLALVVFHAQEPMLYTAENTSSIGEVDLSVAETMDPTKAETVMPLLQDILGQGETVVLSVKVKDWESAEKELEEYAEMTRSMDNLVLSLDLSETDLHEFREKSRENRDALTSLVNGTARLDHLKQLEITYRDSDDPSKYYSVVYEQEAIREELQNSYTNYAGNSRDLATIGEQYEADTADLKQSVEDYGEIVEEETGRPAPTPGPGIPPPQIGIALAPEEAAYGEMVRWHGRLESGEEGVAVESYLDSRLFATAATGADGNYAVSYRVGKVRAGPHLVYVQAGRSVSDLVPFTVRTAPSSLSLGVSAEGEVAACTGSLTANGRGVAGAGVRIIVDDAVAARPVTGENGTYEVAVPLEAGEHVVRAEFTAEGYPLGPSSSEEVAVQVGPVPPSLIPVAGGVAVGLFAGAVALWWSRRRPASPSEIIEPAHSHGDSIMTAEERAIQDVQIPAEPLTPAEAAFRLWDDLADAAGIEYGVKNPRARTPRELVKALRETPGAESAAAFVKAYERLRYAGAACTWDEVEELERLLGAFRGSRVP